MFSFEVFPGVLEGGGCASYNCLCVSNGTRLGRGYILGCICYGGGICDGSLLVIFVAPDVAKASAIPGPIPDPPPVMNTDFPAVESSGRVTDIAGYGAVCHDLVKGGKAIASL